jgi:hypothetical protein
MTEKRDSSLSQAIMVMDALMLHFKESRVSPRPSEYSPTNGKTDLEL